MENSKKLNSGGNPQKDAFLASEGDEWFRRNAKVQLPESPELEIIEKTLGPFKKDIGRFLEIGCSSGKKLESLVSMFDCQGDGIDPSSEAISSGRTYFSNKGLNTVRLSVGTADQLPFEGEVFDVVYFGFCLYLIDRAHIFKAITEADRVLKKGGFLAILDFDSPQPCKRPYHHKPGIFSYKNNYTNFFTSTGHYSLVCKQSFSHAQSFFSKDPQERIAINILYKEHESYLSA